MHKGISYIDSSAFGGCININDIKLLKPNDKKLAVVEFAKKYDENNAEKNESYEKYLKANASKLVDIAIENSELLTIMCKDNLISAKDIELYVQKAIDSNNLEIIALILDYKTNKISNEDKSTLEKQNAKKEEEVFRRAVARSEKEGIDGLKFVISGTIEKFRNRDNMVEYIKSHGGTVVSSVSAKVDFLITNETDLNSQKIKDAKALGLEIINEDELIAKVGNPFIIKDNVVIDCAKVETDLIIPDNVTEVGKNAFLNCGIKSIVIPQSVTKISEMAFAWCEKLESVFIPGGVKKINEAAFARCKKLENINVDINNKFYVSIDGNLYSKDGKTLIAFALGKTNDIFTIPDSVTKIWKDAFLGCENLTSIVIPDSVTEIGISAFKCCKNLTSIVIPDGVTKIGEYAFYDCENLTNIVIPDSVTKINFFAFEDCKKLTIHTPAGSYAETYAKKNKIPFIAE